MMAAHRTRRLLLPVDRSIHADRAAQYLAELRQLHDARGALESTAVNSRCARACRSENRPDCA